ncbi:MAG TPA: UDP-N-acetylmuramoyl-L-alanyl-D-glutamate--2,6-diaminopimelate ligase [Candidatus Kapabacteria bacterium]|nr:UDP-N-acetylmuramoyl-L-alanyl-D-glutamate--2,6-diaminopimelate ligase [Candidatus Kapabacteria bacterium]
MKFSEQIPSPFPLPHREGLGEGWPEEIGLLDAFGEADLARPQYDSRRVTPGDTFVAIRGFAADGHKFIRQAIVNGAKAIVLEENEAFSREDAERANVARMHVQNSRRALAFLSERAFGSPSTKLRMIGVTGTNGKTTVTSIIRQLLSARSEKAGLIGTTGIYIGETEIPATHTTPESREISELLARMVDDGVTTCVMEVSSHALALERVAALDFDIAVFTNLTRDHLDFHHTMEEYFAAKQKLFDGLKDTAVAITNADDAHGLAIVENTIANVHTYGIRQPKESPRADIMAFDVGLSEEGTVFRVEKRYSEERAIFESPLVGAFNVENVMAAVSALYFGVEGCSLEVLAELIRDVKPARGRFERIQLPNGAIAIVDYAHTPDALQNTLDTLHTIKHPSARIITIFGCGGDRDRGKRPKMGEIAAKLSDFAIITNDNPRSEDPRAIIDDIIAGVEHSALGHIEIEPDRAIAINLGLSMAKTGDIVLVAGKGHENYQVIGSEKHHFDDREEILKYE